MTDMETRDNIAMQIYVNAMSNVYTPVTFTYKQIADSCFEAADAFVTVRQNRNQPADNTPLPTLDSTNSVELEKWQAATKIDN